MKSSRVENRATVCVGCSYAAPAERVFAAWLDPRLAGRWLFATASRPMARVAIDARVGGAFRFAEQRDGEAIEYTGRYLAIAPPRRLEFTLSGHDGLPQTTRVAVEVVPAGTGCRVNVVHENVPPERAGGTEARWTGILYGLGTTLEAGATAARGHGSPRRSRPVSKSGPAARL